MVVTTIVKKTNKKFSVGDERTKSIQKSLTSSSGEAIKLAKDYSALWYRPETTTWFDEGATWYAR